MAITSAVKAQGDCSTKAGRHPGRRQRRPGVGPEGNGTTARNAPSARLGTLRRPSAHRWPSSGRPPTLGAQRKNEPRLDNARSVPIRARGPEIPAQRAKLLVCSGFPRFASPWTQVTTLSDVGRIAPPEASATLRGGANRPTPLGRIAPPPRANHLAAFLRNSCNQGPAMDHGGAFAVYPVPWSSPAAGPRSCRSISRW